MMSNAALNDARGYRLSNIDMLRGLVIVIMALDHVRDFMMTGGVQDPMAVGNPEFGLYVTRWVTHFCAPVFIFLAGTSAGLMADRKSPSELGGFLFKRGLWLIFVEFAIISTAYSFSPFGTEEFGGLTMLAAQVIWAIGVAMVALAGMQYFGIKACFIVGAIILLIHNFVGLYWPQSTMFATADPVWYALFSQAGTTIGPFLVFWAYPIVPWIGVMLLGFGTVGIFKKAPVERDALLRKIGLSMIAAFIVLRSLDFYGDPNPWIVQEAGMMATVLDFMNVSKYPPSLMFILATMGPMAIFISYADRMKGWWKDALVMFGRVPFAFYVAHFYLIHTLAIGLGVYQGFEAHQFMKIFFLFPEGYGVGLMGVYLWWFAVIAILYPFCKWVAGVKARRKDWWLSYL